MKLFRMMFVLVAALTIASCSKKPTAENESPREKEDRAAEKTDGRIAETENQLQPEEQDILDDCVAFLTSTVATRSDTTPGQCPVCPSSAEKAEVLGLDSLRLEKVDLSIDGASCEATVQIRGHFNPSNGGTITGGLVGWIPAEQRTQYTRGVTPSGQQVYHVKITYRREGREWQVADFALP